MTQEQSVANLPSGQYHYGTGRRKTAIARVRLYSGSGNFLINNRPYLEIFTRPLHQNKLRLPFDAAEVAGTFDVYAKVTGGGVGAWADAVSHGIARALLSFDEKLRPALRKAGLLTRDPRIKERKKPGLKRARKAPQYTKR
jgi:small subunit ribosomal protein S9